MTAPDTSQVRRTGELGLLLPSDWWVVHLQDERARRRSVQALVQRQFGRTDSPTPLALDARRELDAVTLAAARSGGGIMAFSLLRVADVPLPASVTTFRLPAPTGPAAGSGDTLIALAELIRSEDVSAEVELAEGPLGQVVRAVSVGRGPEALGAETIDQLSVRYWLDPDDGLGRYHLAFSTPLVRFRDAMLDLFDVLVASVGYSEPGAEDGDSAPGDDEASNHDEWPTPGVGT